MESKVVCADQPDDPALFRVLSRRPKVAWPTILLVFVAYGIFGASTFAHVQGDLPFLGHLVQQCCRLYFLYANPRSITPHGEF